MARLVESYSFQRMALYGLLPTRYTVYIPITEPDNRAKAEWLAGIVGKKVFDRRPEGHPPNSAVSLDYEHYIAILPAIYPYMCSYHQAQIRTLIKMVPFQKKYNVARARWKMAKESGDMDLKVKMGRAMSAAFREGAKLKSKFVHELWQIRSWCPTMEAHRRFKEEYKKPYDPMAQLGDKDETNKSRMERYRSRVDEAKLVIN